MNSTNPAIDAGTSLNRSHTLYARINLLYRPDGSFVDYVNRHRVYVAPALTWDISQETQLTLLGRYQHDTGHMGFPLPAAGTVLPNPNGEIPISLFVGEPSNPNPVSEVNKQFGYLLSHRFSDSISFYQNFRVAWYENHWNSSSIRLSLGATSGRCTAIHFPTNKNGAPMAQIRECAFGVKTRPHSA